jgi:S-DNA-T family DNA segregation ATPase FtsK/SpoIIIE
MSDIFLNVHYDKYFREIDISKYEKNVISIGKSVKCDIVLNSDSLSDKEVLLKKDKEVWYMVDNSGRGFTFKNKIISKKKIEHGNVFLIGRDSNNEHGTSMKVAVVAKTIDNYNTLIKRVFYRGMSKITIGKDISNNIIFNDILVSTSHAKIYFKNSDYYIADLGSVNGIYVNGNLVKQSILKASDTIVVGGNKIVFHKDKLDIYHSGKELNVQGFRKEEDIRVVRNVFQDIFMRSPRLRAEMPNGEVELLRPPGAPNKPQISWLSTLMPPILMGTSMIIISRLSGYNPIYMAATLLVSFGTIPIYMINYFSQKKKYKKDLEKRDKLYRGYISGLDKEYEEKRESQSNIMYEIHPSVENCMKRVLNRDRRLWERAVQYEDFLSCRMGIGKDEFRIKFKTTQREFNLDGDELHELPNKLKEKFIYVKDIPICIPLGEFSTVGFLGKRERTLNFLRSFVTQIATHHSYDEVKIVSIFPTAESEEWNWMKWLPHVWDEDKQLRFMADDKENAQIILSRLYDELKQREMENEGKQSNEIRVHSPHYLFFLADMSLLENQPILSYLIYNKENMGITSLFFFDRLELLPKDCQAIVELKDNIGNMYRKDNTSEVKSFSLDNIDLMSSEKFSRKLSSIKIKQMISASDLPTFVPLLDVFDVKSVESLNIRNRWETSMPYKTMAAPIGIRLGGEKLLLDLHEKSHGPHGLVAGTTGSGKSEILQTFIIAMAINFHPHEVAFVIIDYKGGGMANAFEGLPHLMGTITNLGGNQTKRAMICIYSEIKKRQRMFEKYSVNHIDAYQKLCKKDSNIEPMPHLIIVADEFAELKSDNPEFIDDLVSAARVGRSLGVHLILATQKPSGVVNDQIWSNSRFKLCLKVQDAEDSREMLKRPDAANIKEPGRSYLQVGNNEIFELFQSAYSGAAYDPNADEEEASIDIYTVDLSGRRTKCNESKKIKRDENAKNQLDTAIDAINKTVKEMGIKKLNDIWPEMLPEELMLGNVINRDTIWNGNTWIKQNKYLEIAIGIMDYPAMQSQENLSIDFGEVGHLAVPGGPGGGKTTFITTFITSAILSYSPDELNIYIMDFGTRTLNIFSTLAHVGGVVMSDDDVKLSKLSKYILKEIDKRKKLFSEIGVSNIISYRLGSKKKMPAIFLVVDNTVALYEMYEYMVDDFALISREGANLGIHLVLTANDINGIGYKVVGNIKSVCAIQLTDKSDYSVTVGSSYGLFPADVKGRGLINGNPALEFQTALACKGETEMDRAERLKSLLMKVNNSWDGGKAREIPIMPEIISYEYMKDRNKDEKIDDKYSVSVGLDSEDIEPVYVNLKEMNSFVISGASISGKTNLMKLWILSMANQLSTDEIEFYIIDSGSFGLYPIKEIPHVREYVGSTDGIESIIDKFKEECTMRKEMLSNMRKKGTLGTSNELPDSEKKMVLVIDDLNDFCTGNDDDMMKEFLSDLIKRERGLGIYIVSSGVTNDIVSSYTDSLLMTVKDLKSGLLFGPPADHSILNINLPYSQMSKALKQGECYLAYKNKVIKLLTTFIEDEDIKDMINDINRKYD